MLVTIRSHLQPGDYVERIVVVRPNTSGQKRHESSIILCLLLRSDGRDGRILIAEKRCIVSGCGIFV